MRSFEARAGCAGMFASCRHVSVGSDAIEEAADITCNETIDAHMDYSRRIERTTPTGSHKRHASNSNVTLLQSVYSKSGTDEVHTKLAVAFSDEDELNKLAETRNVNCSSRASRENVQADGKASSDGSCKEDETRNISSDAHDGFINYGKNEQMSAGVPNKNYSSKVSNGDSQIKDRENDQADSSLISIQGGGDHDVSINDDDHIQNSAGTRNNDYRNNAAIDGNQIDEYASSMGVPNGREEGEGCTDAGLSLMNLLARARYAEVCRQLQSHTEHRNDARFERAKVIHAECLEAVSQLSGTKISDHLVRGKSASGVDWGYTLTDDALCMGSCSNFDAGLVEIVAGMFEMDVQGHDPQSQSARWQNRRRSSFANWLQGDTSPAVCRRGSVRNSVVVGPVRGMRDDIVYVEELDGIENNPAESVWNVITENMLTKSKCDDVIVMTVADMLDEPNGGVMILAKPAQGVEGVKIPPPRPKHHRYTGLRCVIWVQPMPAGGCQMTTSVEFKLSGLIGKAIRWIPGFMIQRALSVFFEEDYKAKSMFFKSLLIARTIQRETRADLYKSLNDRVEASSHQ